jgi:prepilin-type N-terminal cleavage/methylation domain-containing protein
VKQSISSEDGFSLLEILIAMMILGIGAVSIMAAIGTSVFSATAHRSYASAETVTRDFAEAVSIRANSAVPYVPCPTVADLTPTAAQFTAPTNTSGQALYLVAVEAPPSPWTTDSTAAVQYWIPGTFPNGSFSSATACDAALKANCPVALYSGSGSYKPTASCDPGLQRVWIHVKTNPVVANSCAKLVDCVDQYSRILVRRYDAKTAS